MPIIFVLSLLLVLGLLLFLLQWKWCQPTLHNHRLPPGSMGWPYIGETLKLYTQHPNSFFSVRRKKYGNIFKSHILGCPCVMIASPEAAKVVLVSKAHLFRPTYPPSKMKMIGPEALFFHQGDYHLMLKKLVQASFSPSAIRGSVPAIENIVLSFLPDWENSTTLICTLQEMKKARKALDETLMRLIEKRRGSGEAGKGLLGILLAAQKQKQKLNQLSDSQVADNIIGVIFAAHDTTASVSTWVLKYLHDNPNVLEAVQREQEGIRRKLQLQDKRGLTWDDTRHMLLTTRVIQETLRSASILSFTFREAVEDVEFQGYVIPKGSSSLQKHSPLF
ncbi:UNVERIFIED_CONTAM: Abscisic acid 8'-hydroxylase 2 [Sesamum latifolium]|uniref:Abscisic acid 8'-hydroxylase 2 n=1 Tax=Sesamum latifolium TaxID=2727402 RepID=A0AAW2Y414_9LAMI